MDGYGDPWSPVTESCTDPVTPGYAANDADCDDFDPSINPDAPELCNGLDDNCNSVADEGVRSSPSRPGRCCPMSSPAPRRRTTGMPPS
ncbi:putative metal-binding motif-containing protein [Sorangium sp. So ce124]|uniref:putative metal-binding motif-containing protein n=1 Tax=Sorangium sp. So ce124 TaxID=3133280 RepID=UPI003F61C619